MRIIALIMITMLSSGCAATYTNDILKEPTAKLARGKSVAIATPGNGFYGGTEYPSSGAMTARAIQAAFSRYATTTLLSDCKDLPCMRGWKSPPVDYYIVSEILHWEDRATEWSGKPDKLEVKVTIYEGQTGNELASAIISGKSKWLTFGGDHPQDLLPEPLQNYVESLF